MLVRIFVRKKHGTAYILNWIGGKKITIVCRNGSDPISDTMLSYTIHTVDLPIPGSNSFRGGHLFFRRYTRIYPIYRVFVMMATKIPMCCWIGTPFNLFFLRSDVFAYLIDCMRNDRAVFHFCPGQRKKIFIFTWQDNPEKDPNLENLYCFPPQRRTKLTEENRMIEWISPAFVD